MNIKQWLNARFNRLIVENNETESKVDLLTRANSQGFADVANALKSQSLTLQELARSQQLILEKLNSLEEKAMSQFDELLAAQEEGGKIIVTALTGLTDLSTTIAAETADVATTLEQIKNGQLPLSSLTDVVAKVKEQNASLASITEGITKASDSVKAIVPTIISPEVPTPPPAPTTDPLPPAPPVDVVPAPTTPSEVVIEPTPDDVGFENVPAIDINV